MDNTGLLRSDREPNQSEMSLPLLLCSGAYTPNKGRRVTFAMYGVVLLLLLATNATTWIYTSRKASLPLESIEKIITDEQLPRLIPIPKIIRLWPEDSPYNNAKNVEATDALWNAFRVDVGVISVNRSWAKIQNWPETAYHPLDPDGHSKGVYVLESYHLMHCLQVLRQQFRQATKHEPIEEPLHHAWHCFDALRHSILCQADQTPLATFTDPSTLGQGSVRECQDWSVLRAWAAENSACYSRLSKTPNYKGRYNNVPFIEHFGHCNNGEDGLVLT